MRYLIYSLICLALSSLSAAAATVQVQYRLDTLRVTSIRPEVLPPVEGYGTFETDETLIPVPAGCTDYHIGWFLVTTPPTVVLDTTIPIFTSSSTLFPGCAEVHSWAALQTIAQHAYVTKINERPLIQANNHVNTQVYITTCPTSNNTAPCPTVRTQMNAINNTPTLNLDATELNAFLTQVQDLIDDAVAFKIAQCNANPGGPFC